MRPPPLTPAQGREQVRQQVRWLALILLLALELAWGINAFTVPELAGASGLPAFLIRSADVLLKVGVAVLGTFILILSRERRAILTELRAEPAYHWWGWLAAHLAALLVFIALAWPVFGPSPGAAQVSTAVVVALAAAGLATFMFLLFAGSKPQAWLAVARREWLGGAASILAGIVAFAGGTLANQAWFPLAELTLRWTRWLLAPVYPDLHYDPGDFLIGANDFVVQIAPVCSGIEGMALMTVFVIAYLWLFRRELRFPAAFLLLPLGIVAIWFANVLRIALLIIIGASYSPDIAVEGWHSQAGWIGFSGVALALIALAHRVLQRDPSPPAALAAQGSALPLLMPLLALMASSMLVAALSSGFAPLYPVSVIATAGALWVLRRHYQPVRWQFAPEPFLIGILVFVAWLMLDTSTGTSGDGLLADIRALPAPLAATWIAFRVLGCVVTVPIAEELAFRGYLIRKLVAADFESVRPGQFTWLSFTGSSLLFGFLHQSWLAGAVAGAGFALALYRRGSVGDAIVAHVTTNGLVAGAVLLFGRWELWA